MKNIFIFALLLIPSLSFGQALEIPGFDQVSPGIFRGGRPTESDIQGLAARGIKTLIDLQGGDSNGWGGVVGMWEPGESKENIALEQEASVKSGIAFFNYPLSSVNEVTHEEDAEIDQVLTAMADPAQQPVFIHCEHGKDRTGLIVALYRIKYEGWTVDAAYQEWEDHGHNFVAKMMTGKLDDYFYDKVRTLGPDESRPKSLACYNVFSKLIVR